MSHPYLLLKSFSVAIHTARFNCYRASIGKIRRTLYHRFYPVLLVNPNGNCYSIRFREPRKIIQLPLDPMTLSDEERRERLSQRKGVKQKMDQQDTIDDSFNSDRYNFLWKLTPEK
ncbi:unnamed protein product [Soboliphyme baturini]|uniref:39S ribosomal protein L55, mitochondrial n=1 Tax=Soboliphyme baturini TaxID=241478 RepID=A0A183IMM9_9BILA|nr:unnamed protein product [Soboliphyme baturini]